MDDKPKIGISSCLLGNKVRYDGRHKYDAWLVETLGKYVTYVPVCPEVECGLSVPRDPMRLVGEVESPRLLIIKDRTDHTPRMLEFRVRKLSELADAELCGFIFKSKSPSCGTGRVIVHPDKNGSGGKEGMGIFAREFIKAFPLLPVEEESRLQDPALLENFIERVYIIQRRNKPRR